jgi:phosphotriesterase-related protein
MGCYECDEVFHLVLPHLEEIRDLGVRTLMDTTPKYLGRDVRLLRRLSEASGLHIITNTGYYGALNDHHLPEHAFSETAEEIARRWIQEWTDGIDDTGIRPGMMKIGVDAGTLSEMDAKLVRAAAITHLQTGLTIAAHGGSAVAAFGELEVLEEEGVHPSAWIWVHAQAEEDIARHVEAARLGAWVEFDGISPESVNRHVDLVDNMRRHNLLDRTLISQDAGRYTAGEPGGGTFRRYSTLLTEFIPALRHAGLEDGEIDHLVTKNPAEAFRIRERSVRR